MRRPVRRLLAIGLGLIAAFAIGEIVCRVAGLSGLPEIDPVILEQRRQARNARVFVGSDDPLLLYTLRPRYSSNGVPLTEVGGILRAEDVPVEKAAGVTRIVVLGDSIAASLAMRVHRGVKPFPDLLEEILNERAPQTRVEVLNFGTDGYGTLQEARLLETKAVRYDPDLILVQYCYNDPGVNVTPAIWFLEPEEPWSWLVGTVVSRFRTEKPEDLDPRRARLVPDQGPVTPKLRRHWESLYDPESASWARVVTGFERIAAVGKARGVPVVLVVFPLLSPPTEDDDSREVIRGMVFGEARRHGFTIVDLRDAFSGIPPYAIQEFPGLDPYHPNARGHRIAARAIADRLEGVLSPR